MDGQDFVRKYIADRLQRNRDVLHRDALTSGDIQEIKGVALGLRAAGAMDQSTLMTVIDEIALLPQFDGTFSRSSPIVADRRGSEKFASMHYRGPAVDSAAGRELSNPFPLRVIPLLDLHAGKVPDPTILSIEIWTTMLGVRFAYPGTTRPSSEIFQEDRTWTATDDTGIQYKECGNVYSDMKDVVIGTKFLEPGPTPSARELTLIVSKENDPAYKMHIPLMLS